MQIKALVIVAVIAGSVGTGWLGRSWYEDSVTLTVERALDKVRQSNAEAIAGIAKDVQGQIGGIEGSERVIDRGIIREIEKTVYLNRLCFEPELVRLLNLGAQGPNADLSGEFTGGLPGGVTDAE